MPETPVLQDVGELIRSTGVQTIVAGRFASRETVTHVKTVEATIVAMTIRGRYEVSHGGRRWVVRPDEAFVVPARTSVRIVHHPDPRGTMQARWVHLHLTLHGSIDLLGLFDLPGRLTRSQSEPVGHAIGELLAMDAPAGEQHRFEHLLACHTIATGLAGHLIRQSRVAPQRIRQLHQSARLASVFQAVAQHLHRRISLEDLCRWAHLSPSRLHAVFREVTGTTPMQHVMQMRLAQARQQLIYTDQPVAEIARSLAFASPFHFSRVFRAQVGVSPSAYRAQNSVAGEVG